MSWEGVIGVVGAAASAGFGALITYLKMKHTQEREVSDDKHKHDISAVEQYKEIADRLEKQNAKWELDSDRKQRLIEELVERDIQCQVSLTKYWSWIQSAHVRLVWLTKVATDAGHKLQEDVLPLPDSPRLDQNLRFTARTSAQDTVALKAAQSQIPTPPGAK